VIRSLVSIAQARGWEAVTVSGTDRFRKEAWMAARLAGLGVRGYAASAFEQQRLVQLLARAAAQAMTLGPDSPRRESASAHSRTPKSRARPNTPHERPRRGELLTGVLIDHGPARYRDHPQEAMSYFVKLETERGERKIWGVDLERALRESLTKPQIGEAVGLRAVRQDAVTVKSRERDATGAVIAEKNLATHRNRWIIEKRAFLDERAAAARTVRDASIAAPRAVREHPELAGTYAQLRAADLTARGMRDRADRELFVARVRNALADAIARGEPLPAVRLRERAAARAPATPGRDPPRQPAPTR
jgi:putative DNA primase/helicase